MDQNEIEIELSKWKDESFQSSIAEELSQYVAELDIILYKRYMEKIDKLSPKDRTSALSRLKSRELIDDNLNYVSKTDTVKLDDKAKVANGGYYKGKILVNPNSAIQFYSAYSDFSNGMTDGIRELDFNKKLSELEDISPLETLYWHYTNKKTYQDFLKSTMLHEDVHRWTLGTDILDDPIDIFSSEGLVETEARSIAKENDIEYAHCFRNDEVNLISFLDKYNILDKSSMMLCFQSDQCIYYMIGMAINGKTDEKEINPENLLSLRKTIYKKLNTIISKYKQNNIEKNYREIFASMNIEKSCQLISVIEDSIEEFKNTNLLINKNGIEESNIIEESTTDKIYTMISNDTLDTLEKIGAGACSDVYKYNDKAIKVLNTMGKLIANSQETSKIVGIKNDTFVFPEEILKNEKDEIIGYILPLVDGQGFIDNNIIKNLDFETLKKAILKVEKDLKDLSADKIVCDDLNHKNIMWDSNARMY